IPANLADPVGALESFRKMISLAQDASASDASDKTALWDLANVLERLGAVMAVAPGSDDPLPYLCRSFEILNGLAKAVPQSTRFRSLKALLYQVEGSYAAKRGDMASALRHYREALPILDGLVREEPTVGVWQTNSLRLLRLQSVLLASMGDR